MRISRPFSLSLVLALAGQSLVAQASSPEAGKTPASSDHVSAKGMETMDALANARSRSKPGPTLPSPIAAKPSAAMKRRALEAIKSRKADPAMDTRVRAARAAGEAQLARDWEAMAKRLSQALGLEAPSAQSIADAAAPEGGAHQAWVPVLFASSSVPVATLRVYARQLEQAHGVIAFRGMPGGLRKVGPMAKLSAEILRRDPGCEGPNCAMRDVQLIVDPILFRQHGVARVPALGLLPGDPTQPYCEREEEGPASARANHLVYGDAALSGLLEEYARLGGKEEVRDAQTRLEAR